MVHENKILELLPICGPINTHISITSNCNLMCKHCYGSFKMSNKFISFSELKTIFNNLKKRQILFVNLSGGEVTTHPNFYKIVKYLDKINLPFFLTTNGIFSKNVFNQIINSKILLGVKVSLDGINAKDYLFIRDPHKKQTAIFDICINNIKNLAKCNRDVTIATLVHHYNKNKLNLFPKFLHNLGVSKWIISPLIPKGRGAKNLKKLIINYTKIDLNELTRKCKRYHLALELEDLKAQKNNKRFVFECGAGIHFMHIAPENKAYPCPLLPYTSFSKKFCANYSTSNFDIYKIWQSKEFKNWRMQQVLGCQNCKLRDKCSRCPIQNDIYKQDLLGEVSFCKV